MTPPARDVALVIPAAGHGSRFGADIPKQFLRLGGMSVLARSLRAFAGAIGEAVIAGDDRHAARIAESVQEAALEVPVRIVPGGATRMHSVARALEATTKPLILVHDAVRPLIASAHIDAVVAALEHHGAALLAEPCAATLKRVTDGQVDATVPRDGLWLAQTPQGFHRAAGREAFARAIAAGWTCSDDAEVLERSGMRPVVVRGDAGNLKITVPGDLALAEALLAGRGA